MLPIKEAYYPWFRISIYYFFVFMGDLGTQVGSIPCSDSMSRYEYYVYHIFHGSRDRIYSYCFETLGAITKNVIFILCKCVNRGNVYIQYTVISISVLCICVNIKGMLTFHIFVLYQLYLWKNKGACFYSYNFQIFHC